VIHPARGERNILRSPSQIVFWIQMIDWKKHTEVGISLLTAIMVISQLFGSAGPTPLVLMGFGMLIFLFSLVLDIFRGKWIVVDVIEKKIYKIERKVDIMERIHNLDKRLSMVESSPKLKGTLDPQIVLFIFMLIIFFLYLREMGMF